MRQVARAEEGLVDVVASFPADSQAAEAVKPGGGRFHDPAEGTQASAVLAAAFGDDGANASPPEQSPLLVVVVAAVGEPHVGPASGPAHDAGHGRDLVKQGGNVNRQDRADSVDRKAWNVARL